MSKQNEQDPVLVVKAGTKKEARNLHACHPIMRKGGVHEKSKGAKRAAAKHETRRKVSEWLGCSDFIGQISKLGFV